MTEILAAPKDSVLLRCRLKKKQKKRLTPSTVHSLMDEPSSSMKRDRKNQGLVPADMTVAADTVEAVADVTNT